MLRPVTSDSEPREPAEVIHRALHIIRRDWNEQPRVGLLLGSGLGGIAQRIQRAVSIDYAALRDFPRPTAAGHQGELVCGRLGSAIVVAFVGRSHLYEGYSAEQLTLPIRLLHALGVRKVVLTNASGGLNPQFQRGDVMLIRDHICFQFLSLRQEPSAARTIHHCTQLANAAYDESLAEWAWGWARRSAIPLRQGVYVAVTGPNYETRAEYRMFRNLGGDAVGMSTALESVTAARLGMQTLGLSMIANVALPDRPQRVTHEEVLAAGALAEPVMARIIEALAEYS